MPVYTADLIHNGAHWLPSGSAVKVSERGYVEEICSAQEPGAIHLEGVLAPGFVNVHCHLELSHMKGLVPEKTGLIPFLQTIPRHRNDHGPEQKTAARHAALDEMLRNGIVALGDIANTPDSLDVRSLDQMHIHTFVEAIGFYEGRAEKAFQMATTTLAAFAQQQGNVSLLRQSIAPHAPYSVSGALFALIGSQPDGLLITMHNQESAEENRFFVAKEGRVRDLLRGLEIDDSEFVPSGKTSLQSVLSRIAGSHPVILVHNTNTSVEDLEFAQSFSANLHWCLCPNANLYIEDKLPDIPLLAANAGNICIGTDSLASNHQLSILAEIVAIRRHYPQFSWETLLKWATLNGAQALNMHHVAGALQPGMKPGILHICGLDGTQPSVVRIA